MSCLHSSLARVRLCEELGGEGERTVADTSFPGRAPCPQARAGCSPTLFSSPSFARNQLGDCNYCKARGGACPARTWSFVKSPSSLEEKEALDEAVAYERWMEEWAVDAQPIVMRKRKRVGEADPGGKGAKWAKRTGERVSEHSKDTPAPLDELGRNDNPLERATHTPSSPNRSTTSKRPASLNVCETRSAESTAQGSGTPATPATASSDLLGTYPSTSSASPAFSPSGLSATSPLLPPPSDQITAAHHLLLAEYKNQQARLALIPSLKSRIAQLEAEGRPAPLTRPLRPRDRAPRRTRRTIGRAALPSGADRAPRLPGCPRRAHRVA